MLWCNIIALIPEKCSWPPAPDRLVVLGMRPTATPDWVSELGVPVIEAGDSCGVGRIQEAVTGGYDAARQVR